MLRIENEGFTGGTEKEFNLGRQFATHTGAMIWGLLHGYGLARIEETFSAGMPQNFDLVHELGVSDWESDLTERELHESFEECPDAWFFIFHQCRKIGVRGRLVNEFHKECERVVAEKVLPDLADIVTAFVKAENLEQAEVTEAQHRKAAIVVGITTDLLRRVLGTRLAEINQLQKRACTADLGARRTWGRRRR